MQLRKSQISFFDSLESFNVDASNIQIINTTPQFKTQLLNLIQSASKRIYITALYLQDDEAGKEVLNAIYEAKQKNPQLDAKIFVDYLRAQRGLMGQPESIGNVRLYRELAERYEHKVDIIGVPVKTKEVLGVLHLKGFIFDNTLLYSGASINNIYLQQESRYRTDRYHQIQCKQLTDSMCRFLDNYIAKSSAVKSLNQTHCPTTKQIKNAIRLQKKNLRHAHYRVKPCKDHTCENPIKVTPLLGFGGRKNLLNKAIFQLVRSAQHEVTIFTPYFNFPAKVSKAIRRILKAGKIVNIVVGDKVANDFYIPEDQAFNKIGIVPYVYETNLRQFLKRNQKFINSNKLNVYLWKHEDNSYHLKGINCDDEKYLITGHNINPRAWSLDLENGVLLQDPKQQLKEKFEKELAVILTHTKRVKHFEEVESIADYPEAAKKLMKNVKRAKLDSILNRLL